MHLARLYRTVRHLRFQQLIARLRFKFRRIDVGQAARPELARVTGQWVDSIRKNADIRGTFSFWLLNKTVHINSALDWNDPKQDKLILYHLHYHDVLNHDVLNASEGPSDGFDGAGFINKWTADNPPTDGNAWEPYPLSLRIVNWIKWHLEGNDLGETATASLFLQARALYQQIEYHLLANHIFANAKALYFAGLFFADPESAAWKRTAIEILRNELQEQILEDGGHFELSPMYQATIAEDVLDILNIGRAYGESEFSELPDLATQMIRWLALMSHGDGRPSYFNDATIGVAPLLADIANYAEGLGVYVDLAVSDGLYRLEESGYVRFQNGPVAVMIDVGPVGPAYQPGHAHCDCLSFELSTGFQRLLVNSGVSTYNINERRLLERQTASHNTVSIEGGEQSEVWGAFRVGSRAKPVDVDVGDNYVSAGHDGYRVVGVTHRRRFRFDGCRIEITDKLDDTGARLAVAHFHFYPEIMPVLDGAVIRAGKLKIVFEGATSVDIQDYKYSEGFNKLTDAKKLTVSFVAQLTTKIDYESLVHI